MQKGTLIKTLFLRASPEKVWAYLTESNKLATWFHEATNDLADQQDYTLLNDDGEKLCWGTVTESEPHSRLKYTFHHNYPGGHGTTVLWELQPLHGGTQLLLTHSGLDEAEVPADALASHDKGWDEHFLKLRESIAQPAA